MTTTHVIAVFRVGVFKQVIGYAIDHVFPPKCATMLHDVGFRLHSDVFHWAI